MLCYGIAKYVAQDHMCVSVTDMKRDCRKRDAAPEPASIGMTPLFFFFLSFSWIISPRKMRTFHSVLLGSQLGSQPSPDVVLPPIMYQRTRDR